MQFKRESSSSRAREVDMLSSGQIRGMEGFTIVGMEAGSAGLPAMGILSAEKGGFGGKLTFS